jgi:hypothetical protein
VFKNAVNCALLNDVVHRLYHTVVYFQNVIGVQVTRINVITREGIIKYVGIFKFSGMSKQFGKICDNGILYQFFFTDLSEQTQNAKKNIGCVTGNGRYAP